MHSPDTQSLSFDSLGLPTELLDSLQRLGYETATPIQSQAIPALLEGRDVVGIAQTGTGKTAAFALPTLAGLDVAQRKPQVLVLCPTRELSMQVADAYRNYARGITGVKTVAICGGEDMRQQLRSLKDGVHIVVATPGRLLDHLNRGTADFSGIRSVVLDEADEMLRMGFIDDVDTILEKTPKHRRVALFSATMPPRVRDIAERHLKSPVEVTVAAASSTNINIEQHWWLAKGASKLEALSRLLAFEDTDGVIVFTRTRESTNAVSEQLRMRGFAAAPLNGDMDQKQRVRTVQQLKSGQVNILVATDVAARGLDVERITHVFNYDIPFDEEAYVHRIGRTGRAGRQGKAILFVAPRERRMLRNIERLTKQQIPELKIPSRGEIDRKQREGFIDALKARIGAELSPALVSMIDELCANEDCTHRDVALALASMLDQPQVANPAPADKPQLGKREKTPFVEESGDAKNARERRREKRSNHSVKTNQNAPISDGDLGSARPLRDHPDVVMERFRIAVGRQHGVEPREIVGAIANEAGIEGKFIGAINIMLDYSTVDLPEGMPKAVLKHLKKTRVKGIPLAMSRVGS